MRFISIFFALFTSQIVFASECNQQAVGATYQIQNKKINYNFELWLSPNQVIHRNLSTNISELWEKNSLGMVKLTRYFDTHKRGIEYQPNELPESVKDWSEKQQLISNSLLTDMTLISTSGHGCDLTTKYQKQQDGNSIELEWLNNHSLVKKLVVRHKSNVVDQIQLTQLVTNSIERDEVLSALTKLYTTDFIDVGDNESDPFLLKMINLGFVKHGASGVYTADGQVVGEDHHHHH